MVIILVFCVFTTRATRWQHQFVSIPFKRLDNQSTVYLPCVMLVCLELCHVGVRGTISRSRGTSARGRMMHHMLDVMLILNTQYLILDVTVRRNMI